MFLKLIQFGRFRFVLSPRKSVSLSCQRYYALELFSKFRSQGETLASKVIYKLSEEQDLPLSKYAVKFYPHTVKALSSAAAVKEETPIKELLLLHQIYASCPVTKLASLIEESKESTITKNTIDAIDLMTIDQLALLAVCLKVIIEKPFHHKSFRILRRKLVDHCATMALGASDIDCIRLSAICLMHQGKSIRHHEHFMDLVERFQNISEGVSPQQLVYSIYFQASQIRLSVLPLLNAIVPHMNKLSLWHVGIAASAIFQSRQKLPGDNPFLSESAALLKNYLSQEDLFYDMMQNNIAVVNIVKLLNMCGYVDNDLIDILKTTIFNDSHVFDTPSICHLCSYLVECRHYDADICRCLEDTVANILMSKEQVIRLKDLSRVIWILSTIGYKCSTKFLEAVVGSIERMVDYGEVYAAKNRIFDCLLAVLCQNFYPELILKSLVTQQAVDELKGFARSKVLSRVLLIEEVTKGKLTEDLGPFQCSSDSSPVRYISDELRYRPGLNALENAFKWLSDGLNGHSLFEIKFLIPHLNKSSIVINFNSLQLSNDISELGTRVIEHIKDIPETRVCIEINDESSCLSNFPSTPYGLEILKRRILRERGWTIIEMNETDILECRNDPATLISIFVNKIMQHYE